VTAPVNSPANSPEPVTGAAGGSDIEQQILESISKPWQEKVYSLQKHLKNSKVLTWTPEGEISYRGQPISHSNIADLMTEALRQKPLKHRKLPTRFDKICSSLERNQ
jgi:hypothetical protein